MSPNRPDEKSRRRTPADPGALDNVVWHALRGPQAKHARWTPDGRAVRFDPAVSVFTAVERLDEEGWRAMADLVGPKGAAVLFRDRVDEAPAGWQEAFRGPTRQLVAGEVPAPAELPIETLSAADAPEMLALAQRTEPGPFLLRTGELGTYVGIRESGKLVAMAGERMRVPGFTEISAVCTDARARGRGYGGALTAWMTRHIRERGDEAFLHVLETNHTALRLYESLGFRTRRSVDAVAVVWSPS